MDEPIQTPRQIAFLGKAPTLPHLSYPLGSEPISAAFSSFPDFDKLLLSFSLVSPLLQSHWAIPGYPVIRITYTRYPEYVPRSESIGTRRQGGTRWHIEVLVVPKEKRIFLQPLIIEMGLPLLLEWMTGPEAPNDETHRAVVELWWFEDTQILKLHVPKGKPTH